MILPLDEVSDAVAGLCGAAGTPDCAERTRLIDNIAALADIFAGLMRPPFLRLRLIVVTTNACNDR